MVIYDLICSKEHRFEGWFENLGDLESKLQKRLLPCPVCGNMEIVRLPSTFGLVKKSNPPATSERTVNGTPNSASNNTSEVSPEQTRELVKRWRQFTERVEKEFDNVGSNFATEALKIHYGAAEPRNIRGQSSGDQEKMLQEEGVNFFKVPLLSRKTPTTN